MYTLYSKYGETNTAVAPGSLFAIGFTSSGASFPAPHPLSPLLLDARMPARARAPAPVPAPARGGGQEVQIACACAWGRARGADRCLN